MAAATYNDPVAYNFSGYTYNQASTPSAGHAAVPMGAGPLWFRDAQPPPRKLSKKQMDRIRQRALTVLGIEAERADRFLEEEFIDVLLMDDD